MKVWVDQDLCIGNGICEELCPDVFVLIQGKAYVGERGVALPPGQSGAAIVPTGMEEAAIDAAEACPAECIYIEVVR
jgi:ferredoxin